MEPWQFWGLIAAVAVIVILGNITAQHALRERNLARLRAAQLEGTLKELKGLPLSQEAQDKINSALALQAELPERRTLRVAVWEAIQLLDPR